MIVLLYNLLMLVVVAGAILAVRQQPTPLCSLAGLAGVGVMSFILAVGAAGHSFLSLRLLAWGVFLHSSLMLLACAVLTARRHCRWSVTCAVLLTGMLGVYIDAFWIEPTWLEVTRVELSSPKLDRPLRVVIISDLQAEEIGDYERYVLETASDQQADAILMTGDYIQADDAETDARLREELRNLLAELNFSAPDGVFAVRGNVESNGWEELFAGLPVNTLTETQAIDLERGDVRITGLTMSASFDPDLRIAGTNRFQICFGHCPNFALGDVDADLLVAGHTHGGQVRLPFIGPIVTQSRVPRDWAVGLTELSGGRRLLVSRGIGMERAAAPRLRFLCRPELIVVDIVPE